MAAAQRIYATEIFDDGDLDAVFRKRLEKRGFVKSTGETAVWYHPGQWKLVDAGGDFYYYQMEFRALTARAKQFADSL